MAHCSLMRYLSVMSLLPLCQVAFVGAFRFANPQLRPRNVVRLLSSVASPGTSNRVYLNVPFDDKDEVKKRGARWDPDVKRWYVGEYLPAEDFKAWIGQPKGTMFLKVPFADKDEVKSLGGRWDKESGKWFVPKGVPASLFDKWVDESATEVVPVSAKDTKEVKKPSTEIFFLDIETSGLPNRDDKRAYFPYQNLDEYNNARVIGISGILCDRFTFTPKEKFDLIIKAQGFEITNDKYHGISTERSHKEGVELPVAAAKLNAILKRHPEIQAHNAEFDLSVLQSELFRHKQSETLRLIGESTATCTMLRSKRLVGLSDVNGNPKNPSMKELYQFAITGDATADLPAGTRLGVNQLYEAIKKLSQEKKW